MNWAYIAGVLVGIALALGLFALILFALKKRNKVFSREYDERQKLAQGKAYKAAFFTLLIYVALVALLDLGDALPELGIFNILWIGAFLAVAVMATICILLDAYVSYRDNAKRTLWCLVAIGMCNVAPCIMGFLSADANPYMARTSVANLCAAVLIFYTTILYAIHAARQKKKDTEA